MVAAIARCLRVRFVERDHAAAREPVAALARRREQRQDERLDGRAAALRAGEGQASAGRRDPATLGAAAREERRRLPEVARDAVAALVAIGERQIGAAGAAAGAGAQRRREQRHAAARHPHER